MDSLSLHSFSTASVPSWVSEIFPNLSLSNMPRSDNIRSILLTLGRETPNSWTISEERTPIPLSDSSVIANRYRICACVKCMGSPSLPIHQLGTEKLPNPAEIICHGHILSPCSLNSRNKMTCCPVYLFAFLLQLLLSLQTRQFQQGLN